MMKKISKYGPLFIVIAALLWSLDGVLRRELYALPPAVVVFYEHAIGALVLLPFIGLWWKDLKKMSRNEWIAMIVVSIFSGALGTIFYTAALGKVNYIQYSVVVLLQQLQPIWAILAAAVILKEKISKNFVVWATLALVAAYIITFKDLRINLSSGNGTLIAGILALSAGFMWGTSTAFSKYVLNKVSFLTATALRFFLAPLFALGMVASNNQLGAMTSLSNGQWISLGIIVLTSGLLALAIYYYGLKKTPARVTTICELTWPASAIFIDYVYFHNPLSPTQILGVVLLAVAMYKVAAFEK
jgi:drug/metabolite transporter (DMT)-like permease